MRCWLRRKGRGPRHGNCRCVGWDTGEAGACDVRHVRGVTVKGQGSGVGGGAPRFGSCTGVEAAQVRQLHRYGSCTCVVLHGCGNACGMESLSCGLCVGKVAVETLTWRHHSLPVQPQPSDHGAAWGTSPSVPWSWVCPPMPPYDLPRPGEALPAPSGGARRGTASNALGVALGSGQVGTRLGSRAPAGMRASV